MQRIEYGRLLAAANPQLALDKAEYFFHPGMLFDSRQKWWGDFGERHAPHEGIDICFYSPSQDKTHPLPPETVVPALSSGRVLAVIDDFLGRTVCVSHDRPTQETIRLLSIYAHITPLSDIEAGLVLDAGQIIGRINRSLRLPPGMLPHLHLSVGVLDPQTDADSLSWPRLNKRQGIRLLDPLEYISLPYRIDREGIEKLLIARR